MLPPSLVVFYRRLMSWSEVFKEKFRAGISMDLQGVFEKDDVFGVVFDGELVVKDVVDVVS